MRILGGVVVGVLVLLGCAIVVDQRFRYPDVQTKIDSDERNVGFKVRVHPSAPFDPNILTLDIVDTPASYSPAAVWRVVFAAARATQEQSVSTVALSRSGTTRFLIPGAVFKAAYNEGENPLYLMNAFAAAAMLEAGGRAFPGAGAGGLAGIAATMAAANALATALAAP